MLGINKHYMALKTIKKFNLLPDTYFVSKFEFSPYRACQHACKYCDGRSEKYYVEGDFEKDIVIRNNIADVLEGSLSKFRERGIVNICSGISDSYQPIEYYEKLMPRCATVLAKHKYPVILITKSSLVMRDIDLWEKVHKNAGFTLVMSIVYPNDDLRQIFEPGASSVESRLHTLKAFKARGMNVGVLGMPLLPFLTDAPSQMMAMAKQYAEIGVDFVMPGVLTLRPGINKNTYFKVIEAHFPHLLKSYERLYSDHNQSGAPKKSYSNAVYKKYIDTIESLGMPTMVPHKLYKGRVPIYDEVYILLSHMIGLYERKGVTVDKLVLARKSYKKWLTQEKSFFNRKRSLNMESLEFKLIDMINSKTLGSIIDNKKLVEFLYAVVIDGQVFNYLTLKLENS